MKWTGRRQSTNVEDRRGMSRGGMLAGGGLAGVVIIVVAMLFGVDPTQLLQQVETTGTGGPDSQYQSSPEEERLKEFVSVVLADTEDIWYELFVSEKLGTTYEPPTLTLFSGHVSSACGQAASAAGPFYCPSDMKVYIDLDFFSELAERYGAAGDFAQAYVIAHEIGHHIQNQLGVLQMVRTEAAKLSREESNRLSVRNELQADFLAGVWAHHAQRVKNILEPGDVDEALNAASAIGDDRLQRQSQGEIIPDSFTHGTSRQRSRWFRFGFEHGDVKRMSELFTLKYEML